VWGGRPRPRAAPRSRRRLTGDRGSEDYHRPLCFACVGLGNGSDGSKNGALAGKIVEAGYLRGVVVLPASRLSAGLVEDIGRTALEEGRACAFVHVEIYSEEDYPPSHYLMLSHGGYDWWWMNFQRATPYPVGRIVALGRNAIAEFGDGHGTVTRNVLAGSDPLEC